MDTLIIFAVVFTIVGLLAFLAVAAPDVDARLHPRLWNDGVPTVPVDPSAAAAEEAAREAGRTGTRLTFPPKENQP